MSTPEGLWTRTEVIEGTTVLTTELEVLPANSAGTYAMTGEVLERLLTEAGYTHERTCTDA